MKMDVIITTYNRPRILAKLVQSLLPNELLTSIIIVDSSEGIMFNLGEYSLKIQHVFSKIKNQPFQRYLGYKLSKSDILLFLDDDMEIADENFAEKLLSSFINQDVGAIAINFQDKHNNTSLSKVPKSFINNESRIKHLVNWFTGYPILKAGELGLCGVRGRQPRNGELTQLISGGAFSVRKEYIYKNFNFQLFDLYNKKIGKGEDVILGYTIHKISRIYYLSNLLFYHNDNRNSNYASNNYLLAKRVILSRLYLSLEKCRLDQSNFIFARLHYHWYALWRISGFFINWIINPSKIRGQILLGSFMGWMTSITFKFKFISECNLK